jgi:hypothetical protein
MRLDAMPSLDPAVARALLDLLAEIGPDDASTAYSAAWRRASLREGVDGEESSGETPGYAFSPRSTRGATRA